MKQKRSRGHQKNNLLMQIIDGIRGCITQLKSTDSHCANFMIEKKNEEGGKTSTRCGHPSHQKVPRHRTRCSFNVRSFMLRAPCERLLRQWVVGEVCLRAVAVSLTTPGSPFGPPPVQLLFSMLRN